jgi:DNA-binding transcriptional MerR regulator
MPSLVSHLQTLTIQEVSRRLNVSKHTLRFWEKELEGLLVPLRSRGGQRRYTQEHLLLIQEIKALKQRGLRLAEIKLQFSGRNDPKAEKSIEQKIDHIAEHVAEIVRAAIYNLLEKAK